MFSATLQAAHQSGGEVIIQLKNCGCDQFKGQILELTEQTLNLYHCGTNGGMLWTFSLADIAYCGRVIEMPSFAPDAQPVMSKAVDAKPQPCPELEE